LRIGPNFYKKLKQSSRTQKIFYANVNCITGNVIAITRVVRAGRYIPQSTGDGAVQIARGETEDA